jgi:hypothetical protein
VVGELSERGQPLLGRLLDVYRQGLSRLEGTTALERWETVVLAFATRSYNSLLVAASAIRNAFPIQAIILVRAVYEDVQTSQHIRLQPAARHYWLDDEYAQPRPRNWRTTSKTKPKSFEEVPKVGSMRRAMADQTLAAQLDLAYHVLSLYAHPSVASQQAEYIETPDLIQFKLGPRTEDGEGMVALYLALLFGLNGLNALAHYVAQRQPGWRQLVERLQADVIAWLDEVNVIDQATFGSGHATCQARRGPSCGRG